LIEYPAFHAGEPTTRLFIRTRNYAYQWHLVKGKSPQSVREPLDTQLYDRAFQAVSSWEQAPPLKPEDTPSGGVPGYIGFLSIYGQGKTRQVLLALPDFFIPDNNHPDKIKSGRLSQVFDLISTEEGATKRQ
jgi:hypothetical protein